MALLVCAEGRVVCWRQVKAVEGGRTVSLPGYYKDEEKMLPQWAQEFIPGVIEETNVVLTKSSPAAAVRITNDEVKSENF